MHGPDERASFGLLGEIQQRGPVADVSEMPDRRVEPVSACLTLDEVRELLDADVCAGTDLSLRIERVGAADLMSDVLAFGRPGMLLLTGLNTSHTVRTAAVADLAGIVLVRGKQPSDEMVALARQHSVPLLTTRLTMFEAAGRLYVALKAR